MAGQSPIQRQKSALCLVGGDVGAASDCGPRLDVGQGGSFRMLPERVASAARELRGDAIPKPPSAFGMLRRALLVPGGPIVSEGLRLQIRLRQ